MLRTAYVAMRNVMLGGNLVSLTLLPDAKQAVSYSTECLFLQRVMRDGWGLPQAPVWKGLGLHNEPKHLDLTLYPDAATEWLRQVASYSADLLGLCMLCQILQPKVIFEIGTLRGSGALHLAGNAPGATVYSLDLADAQLPSLSTTMADKDHVDWHSEVKSYFFSGRPEEKRIHCLFGDSAKFDFSPWRRAVDLFFIDGAHSYEYVRNDTQKALECCREGAVIAWHDYGRRGLNGVTRWLHEFRTGGRQLYRVPGGSLAYMRV